MRRKSLVGGQALVEGVMMKGDSYIGRAVYNVDKKLIVDRYPFESVNKRYAIFRLPILRGFISLFEMMIVGMRSLIYSINVSSDESEVMGKHEVATSLLISFSFSILLFVIIPATCFNFLRSTFSSQPVLLLSFVEGIIRMSIFLGFIISTLFMSDMKRLYGFHGAEHKAVNAHEAGLELSVENVMKQSRIHLRCGTTFIMVVFLVSVVVFALIGQQTLLERIGLKLVLFPLISGFSFEIIRLAARYNKVWIFKLLLFPGILVQKLTTREPDEDQVEAAIRALHEAV
jgi:uncharacterized protein YqhQ